MSETVQRDEVERRFHTESTERQAVIREALIVMDLKVADIASHRFYGGDGEPSVLSVVTTSGRKLLYPPDDQTRFVLRDLELEREDLKARAAIEDHGRAVQHLEDRRRQIATDRDRLALQHKDPRT